MRENVLFRAKTIVGRHRVDRLELIKNVRDCKIILKDGNLYLSLPTTQMLLQPLNEGAKEIADLFDADVIENASLYEMSVDSNEIEVVFHRFSQPVKKLTTQESGQLYFYFESNLVLKNTEEKGIDEQGLIKQIKEDCIHHNSIFIAFFKGTASKLSIIGDDCSYRAIEERPGVFMIDKIYPVTRNIPEDQILQIYKGFHFLTWSDSLSVASQNITQITSTSIPTMIVAWDNYIHFLASEVKEKQDLCGVLRYEYADFQEDLVYLHFSEELDLEKQILLDLDNEIEAIDKDSVKEGRIKVTTRQFLGKPIEIDPEKHKVSFKIKDYAAMVSKLREIGSGYIRYSSFSVENETKRREEAYALLQNQSNSTSQRLRRMMDPKIVDTSLPTTERPVTDKVLKTMFGKEKAKTIVLSENYRTAMDIALNTPDIAIIQGPPGCGKTTLINGIMARINEIDPNAKVLLTTEQHDALENAVKGVNGSIPPLVVSKRFDTTEEEETERLERIINKFRLDILDRCKELLSEAGKTYGHPYIDKLVYSAQTIKRSGFDKSVIKNELPNMREALTNEGIISQTSKDLTILGTYADAKEVKSLFDNPLLKTINSQRTSKDAWSDDGPERLMELQELLEFEGHEDLMIEEKLINKLRTNPTDSDFDEYKEIVINIRHVLFPQIGDDIDKKLDTAKRALDNIEKVAMELLQNTPLTIDGIIYEFNEKAKSMENILQVVRNYADIVASTCAQVKKVAKYSSISNGKAKYVVIDEAARINPLDLINTILLGNKVILVGDQMQLPQYLESQAVIRYKSKGGSLSHEYSKLLNQSLFGSLYENLDRAFKEDRIKTRRTIRLDTQYRMNPMIGNFISDTFYDGGLKSADNTLNNINDYGVFNSKNVAFIDIPLSRETKERKYAGSLIRDAEINRIIKLLSEIFNKNPNRRLNIGVLSYYDAQITAIESKVRELFETQINDGQNEIEFGTVDSFQGKEFDIVIISCVRSNAADNVRSAVGFLSGSPNRINVSLSRAKRLLVLVGDSETLGASEQISQYISYVKENGYYEQQ